MKSFARFKSPEIATSTISNVPDAMIVGIDINIESLAESFRENPNSLAPEIVEPALDVPGINASACQNPIITAAFTVQLSVDLLFKPFWSV